MKTVLLILCSITFATPAIAQHRPTQPHNNQTVSTERDPESGQVIVTSEDDREITFSTTDSASGDTAACSAINDEHGEVIYPFECEVE